VGDAVGIDGGAGAVRSGAREARKANKFGVVRTRDFSKTLLSEEKMK
jgi:hypothetical protein